MKMMNKLSAGSLLINYNSFIFNVFMIFWIKYKNIPKIVSQNHVCAKENKLYLFQWVTQIKFT